jgi:hypothetical protein
MEAATPHMDSEDRRRYPRFPGGTMFSGAGPTGNIKATSVDQGPGGAFLETVEALKPDSQIILTVHDPFEREQPVALIARVTHCTTLPRVGIGIEWVSAVCPFGIERLKQFLGAHFHLLVDPRIAGALEASQLSQSLTYDFRYGTLEVTTEETHEAVNAADTFYGLKLGGSFLPKAQFMEVKVLRSGGAHTPRALRAEASMDVNAFGLMVKYGPGEVPSTGPVSVDAEPSSVEGVPDREQWKSELRRRRKATLAGTVSVAGQKLPCVLTHLSREAVFLMHEGQCPEMGDRVIVELQPTVGPVSARIVIMGAVARILKDKGGSKFGLDVRVLSLDEGKHPGFFDQLLMAL